MQSRFPHLNCHSQHCQKPVIGSKLRKQRKSLQKRSQKYNQKEHFKVICFKHKCISKSTSKLEVEVLFKINFLNNQSIFRQTAVSVE